jgi:3-oxoacyl-[acyl-carrier protein] reductase
LFTVQALLPNLANDGQIVLFSTSLTTHPMAIQPGYLQYIMSKGAIEQMVRGLARDPSIGGPDRRITVNAIAPGATGTELFFQGKSQEMLDRISGLMPQQRIGKPEEVSNYEVPLISFV